MNISIRVTQEEVMALVAYKAELDKLAKMIEGGFGQKESESTEFKLPTFNHTITNKAFRAQATLGLGGMDVRLEVDPQFIAEVLTLYAKFANKIAIPIAQFVMAMVMSVTEFEGEAKGLMNKWGKGEKVTEN